MKKIIKCILLVQGIIFTLFVLMDNHLILPFASSNILKFISIILCLCIALLIGSRNLSIKDKSLLQIGMIFTVLADLSLLIYDKYILGLILFSVVQINYYIRYKNNLEVKEFLLLIIFILMGYKLYDMEIINNFLLIIGLFYSLLFLSSFIKSIEAFKGNLYPSPNKYLIITGMILFILCDINVGISYLAKESSLLAMLSRDLIWIFYLPSQICLSLSGYRFQ